MPIFPANHQNTSIEKMIGKIKINQRGGAKLHSNPVAFDGREDKKISNLNDMDIDLVIGHDIKNR